MARNVTEGKKQPRLRGVPLNPPYRGAVVEEGRHWLELRLALGLTQQGLADRLHISNITVSRWERGVLHPSPHFRAVLEGLVEEKRES